MDHRNSEAATVVVSAPLGRAGNGTGGDGAGPGGGDGSLDTNMVIILAALFFALLFAIGLNSVARCALRCGGRAAASAGGGEGASRAGGIKKRALRSIPVEVYGSGGGAGAGAEEEEEEEVCAICLGEFADGEKVRVLPRCGHGFHVPCVDAWLLSRGSCPTCRRPVMEGKKTKEAKPGAAGQSRRPPDSDDTIAVVIA
ncbi:unnamed protein product [Urochloa humidicola]